MKFWLKTFFLILVTLALFVAFPLVFPAPLFAYSASHQELSIHSDRPIPADKAQILLKDLQRRLSRSPIQFKGQSLRIYVANDKWRRNWLWLVVPKGAGGFVAAPFTRWHAFLSGADFKAGALIAPSGYRPYAPRTLAYYGAHELTHVTMAKKTGWLRWQLMPEWIKEGVPDHVAMAPQSAASLYASIGEQNADLPMIKKHGAYPSYRLLVTFFLDEAGWSINRLMASKLSLAKARAIAFKSLRKYRN